MFDYQVSSVEQIAEHVKKVSRQAISEAKKYYTERGRDDVVEKIEKARLLARRDAALAKAERLTKEAGV